ncbi:MAG: aminoacetone oxidase family FAD-binding enzyme [Flavobacteriales bacterium]|nr:aminoacetone oxidase family FAD-binding enzyme [Flavobacteriales bacterium]
MKVAVIGGGAAGFFAAIHVRENHPNASVTIFEKSQKVLAKVKVSGGGRCNVTNGTDSITELAKGYPRGERQLKKAFSVFNNRDTQTWFEKRGVKLYTQPDNRVFPTSNDSQTIIDCLLNETKRLGIQIRTGVGVSAIESIEGGIRLSFSESDSERFDKVIVATGGSPKRTGFDWLEKLGHEIVEPVPSLFTFNMPNESITELMGVVSDNALVNIQGTKLKAQGPLLITHWGMSGPAVLKLSAFGARTLSEMSYQFNVQVNWIGEPNYEKASETLREALEINPNKQISNIKPFTLPDRLWLFLLQRSEIPAEKKANELSKKQLNKLVNTLTNDEYSVSGKTTFKEEFVTCGGVSLSSVNFNTMESRVVPNLYFAGEVLDIDGITGGYNFQAAWTTGFIAGKLR